MDEHLESGDAAGEPVCWIGLLCPECGAMPEGEGAEDPTVPCWRCGAVRAPHAEEPPADTGSSGTGRPDPGGA